MHIRIDTYRPYFIRRFFIAFLIFISLSTIVWFIWLGIWKRQQLATLKLNQQGKVFTEKYMLETAFDDAVLDMRIMSGSKFFRGNFYYTDEPPKETMLFYELVESLLDQKKKYDQIRFLNKQGKEVFRVNHLNGETHIVESRNLQDKSDRYYFRETIKLNKGAMFISPLDLNVENGQIEIPYRPMIRICIPVFNESDQKVGVDILNYDGTVLLKGLDAQAKTRKGQNYLINREGYFLSAPDTSLEWGFMFKNKQDVTIKKIFPNDYQQIEETENGQFETASGLFTISTAYPFHRIGNENFNSLYPADFSWKVLSFVPDKNLSYIALFPLGKIGLLYLISLIVSIVVAYLYAKVSYRKYQFQIELVESERKLKEAVETKDRFFSIISHDLKNVSGAMNQYLDYMNENQESFSKEERTMHMKEVTVASYNHNKLLHEILDWSRLQQGKIDFNPQRVPVKKVFQEQVTLVDLQLKNKQLTTEIETEPDLAVLADEEMLKTILRNLISNAIKFSYREGRIELSAQTSGQQVKLEVRDFGMGMDSRDAEILFDLTSRVQREGTESESGTGFGLKLVAELVEKNKGTIEVRSQPGKGSQFVVTLPAG